MDDGDIPWTPIDPDNTKLHVLLPASKSNPNLCKTTLSLKLLGYPSPTFMGWKELFNDEDQVDGGARLGTKITYALHSVLKTPAHDDDLVLIADGYDTWFQLPQSVLIRRFNDMTLSANYRLADKVGKRAVRSGKIEQKILFGARKECDSPRVRGVRCDSLPKAPLAKNLHYINADSKLGASEYHSEQPQFLDSGYILGRMIDVRTLLIRAKEIVDTTPHAEEAYLGSPQPVFNRIYAEQERRRNRWQRRLFPAVFSRKSEFGIGIDYFSELSHSTFGSERDSEYLTYADDGTIELAPSSTTATANSRDPKLLGYHLSHCALNLPSALPQDIAASHPPIIRDVETPPSAQSSWQGLPLYTHLCTGTIPVLIHHNGDKTLRETTWQNMWFAPLAKDMLSKTQGAVGGWTDTRKWIEWQELCPAEWEDLIFANKSRVG